MPKHDEFNSDYFSSETPMGGFELVKKYRIAGEKKGTKDGRYQAPDTFKYVYKKDKPPQQESAPVEPEVAPEPIPQPLPKPDEKIEHSAPIKQAQDLVDSYKSSIMNTNSPIAQPYGTPAQAFFNDPQKEAADSFLNYKKIQFGEGLNLK